MRQDTKKKIFAGFIIFTFVMSSLAFVITIFTGGGLPHQPEIKQLDSFVVDGQIDSRLEDQYVRSGFTSFKFYYDNPAFLGFVEQLPVMTATNTGQQQLIVQKIPANETYISISALNGYEEIRNLTTVDILAALCRLLTVPPLECATLNFTR